MLDCSTPSASVLEIIRSIARIPAEVEIRAETRLIEDLAVDSLDLVGIILKIQDDFGVAIEDDDVADLRRVGDLTDYVAARMNPVAA